jgi:hypothetical protein
MSAIVYLTFGCRVHSILQDGASRCFAYGFMAYPSMWVAYAKLNPTIDHIYSVMNSAVLRIKELLALPPESKPSVPYAGFDARDVKDFNMENMEEFEDEDEDEDSRRKKDPCYMTGSVDSSVAVSIWLLVLFQMFRSATTIIGDEFRNKRSDDGDDVDDQVVDQVLQSLTDLLVATNGMKEDAYLQCIKVVTALNWQVPKKDPMSDTTEVSSTNACNWLISTSVQHVWCLF